jgi:hypothetical protein
MQNNGTFENSYDYYVECLVEIATNIASDHEKLADACMYAVDLVMLLKSLQMDLPCKVSFDWNKSRLKFEWNKPGQESVVFIISDEEIRSLVYKDNNSLVEINTVHRGSLSSDALYKRNMNV